RSALAGGGGVEGGGARVVCRRHVLVAQDGQREVGRDGGRSCLEREAEERPREKRDGGEAELHADALTPIFGQSGESGQALHRGFRALHTLRPWRISQWEESVHDSRGTRGMRANSIFTGWVSFVSPSRWASRVTCVSTTMPGMP